jgi:hypothetical protein
MPTLPRLRPRNPVALSPLLRKGAVHERSKSGLRAEVKQQLQDELTHWREVLEDECLSKTNPSRNDSGKLTFVAFEFVLIIINSVVFNERYCVRLNVLGREKWVMDYLAKDK